jgi:hypothetical protein
MMNEDVPAEYLTLEFISDIETTLGCGTCSWDGPPIATVRALLERAKILGLDWREIYEAVAARSFFAHRLPPIEDVAPQ